MIDKLVGKIKKLNAPIVVGLDPNLAFVPEHIQKKLRLMNMVRHWKVLLKPSGSSTRQL